MTISTRNETSVSWLLHDLIYGELLIPKKNVSFSWSKEDVKNLIKSLFIGLPIGEMTFWDVKFQGEKQSGCHSLVSGGGTSIHEPRVILDGIERCRALVLVFTSQSLNIENDFGHLDLYYNPVQDVFRYSDEINVLTEEWISLKHVFDRNHLNNNQAYEEYDKDAFYKKIEDREQCHVVAKRVEQLFGIIKKHVNITRYDGSDDTLASDLRFYRNFHK